MFFFCEQRTPRGLIVGLIYSDERFFVLVGASGGPSVA